MALDAVRTSFLAWDRQLCLDLRPPAAFQQGHIAHAVSIAGIDALRSRFSTLPPRGVPFLLVCDAQDHDLIASTFVPTERWAIAAIFAIGTEAEGAVATAPYPTFLLTPTSFQAWAEAAQVWSLQDDTPHLLFTPAPVIQRCVDARLHSDRPGPCTILDLGCGAVRDLAYALVQARSAQQAWRGTGVDRWRAALDRASLLLSDLHLMQTSTETACEGFLPTQLTEDGYAIPLGPRGSAPSPPHTLPDWAVHVLPRPMYDMLWIVRFWPRACLPHLPRLLAPNGWIVLSHFVHAPMDVDIERRGTVLATYDAPPIDARIQPGEIEALLARWTADFGPCCVREHLIEPIEDGRPVCTLVVQCRCT